MGIRPSFPDISRICQFASLSAISLKAHEFSGVARNFQQGVRQSLAFRLIHPCSAVLSSRPCNQTSSSAIAERPRYRVGQLRSRGVEAIYPGGAPAPPLFECGEGHGGALQWPKLSLAINSLSQRVHVTFLNCWPNMNNFGTKNKHINRIFGQLHCNISHRFI